MTRHRVSLTTLSIFAFLISGGITGLIYSLISASDTFTLYAVAASQRIIFDGRIVWEKEIYLWSNTQDHVGLEIIISIISLITNIPLTKLLYMPLGIIIYSLVASLLFVNFLRLRIIHPPRALSILLPISVILVLLSAGNYTSNFYAIFHISFAYPMSLIYVFMFYKVIVAIEDRKVATTIVLVILFVSTALVYYSANTWVFVFTIVTYFVKKTLFSLFKGKVRIGIIKGFGNLLIILFIAWCLVNIPSFYTATSIAREHNKIIPALLSVFYRSREVSPSQLSPVIEELNLLDRALRFLILVPLLIYFINRLKMRISVLELTNDYIVYLILFLVISAFTDIMGYYYHGAIGVYNRHIFLLATLISGCTIIADESNSKDFIKWLRAMWICMIVLLSILKMPYSLTLAENTNVEEYSPVAGLLDIERTEKIFGSYFTFGKLFVHVDIPSIKVKTLDSLYNSTLGDYDFKMLTLFNSALLVVDKNEIEEYVSIRGGFITLHPLHGKLKELFDSHSFVYSSKHVYVFANSR